MGDDVAIVHDYLTQAGGAERVVLALSHLFPEAPIFTSLYDHTETYPEFAELDVRPSQLQGRVHPGNFRRSVLRYPRVFRSLPLSGFDTVVASSSAFAHHVRHPHSFVYCHTPPRFLYRPHTYLPSPLSRAVAPALRPLRRRDAHAAGHHVDYAANSRATADRISELYDRTPRLIYPPLWTGHLPGEITPPPEQPRALVVARLLGYKRVDLAIAAARTAGVELTVVGDGPELKALRQQAGRHPVHFLGSLSDHEISTVWSSHSVILVPGVEDFGYAPVEANYAGRPAIARRAGGALETLVDGHTGLLVDDDDPTSWARALTRALTVAWDPEELRTHAEAFSAERFNAEVRAWLGL